MERFSDKNKNFALLPFLSADYLEGFRVDEKGLSSSKFNFTVFITSSVIAWTNKIRKITEHRMCPPFCLTEVVYQYGRTDIITCFDVESISKSI